jgi:hypothetical protein
LDQTALHISELETNIAAFSKKIENLTAEIAAARVELQRAGEDRKAESLEFQKVVAEQIALREVLAKATDRMKQFYEKKQSLLQEPIRAQPGAKVEGPPPALRSGEHRSSAGAGGVLGMLAEIEKDSQIAQHEAEKSEQDAQLFYEDFVSRSNTSVKDRSASIISQRENRAAAEKELVQAKETHAATQSSIEQLASYNAQLHTACDFVLKNFQKRQQARSDEIEALGQAKNILSGAQ